MPSGRSSAPSPPVLAVTSAALIQARWVIPDGVTFLSPGCLLVEGGRITRVWEGSDSQAYDLGDVAILPGLINAHTHLEFSDLPQPLPSDAGFPDWIRRVIHSRRERGPDVDARQAIRRGWEESLAVGTVAIGEIATSDASGAELASLDAAGVVFREALGLQEESVPAVLETTRRFLLQPSPTPEPGEVIVPNSLLRRGLSPHAPYSLHPQLFRGLIDLAVESGAAAAMHLAETTEELDLLARHQGGLADLLQSLGLWRRELFTEFRRPLDYLHELSRCRSALVVHGNYLAAEEIAFLSEAPHLSVVYCPRTHAAFGHTPHPWRELLQRGARVVLGTDSRASNPDLSLWRELQWLHARHPEVPVATLLHMATRDAAEALGLAEHFGRLEAGAQARWTVVRPASPLSADDWSGLLRGTVVSPD